MDTIPNTIVNKYYDNLDIFNNKCEIVSPNCLNIVQWNVRGINVFEI